VVYIKGDSIVEKLIFNDQERKMNKLVEWCRFPPNSKQINIKKEHVDYNHHMLLLVRQEIEERNEQTTNKGRRNGEK
jgi:hypothetical protein